MLDNNKTKNLTKGYIKSVLCAIKNGVRLRVQSWL